MKIFLSHSSKDKPIVRRIEKALRAHHFDMWLDEEQIPFGGSIVEFINRGLTEADVLVVFLSRHSVASKWVENEWQAQFFAEVGGTGVTVIPVLLSDCEIPKILNGRRHADFRESSDFESGLAALVGQLQHLRSQKRSDRNLPRYEATTSILEHTKELLNDLEGEYISMPSFRRLSLIGTLKRMPRQGKWRRLAQFKPRLRVRTIYDHMLSVAHSADCLLPAMKHKLPEQEFASVALCIAYHELNEVVLGDIPSFTSLGSGTGARNHAEDRLRGVLPSRREEIATNFVWLFLSEKHRVSTEAVARVLKDERSEIFRIFKLLDKLDPIIAVWRYLHEYRGRLGQTPKRFNSAMKDFFTNPDIKSYIKAKSFDERVLDLVINLQDRDKAWRYYQSPNQLFNDERMFAFDEGVIRGLIEGISLFHAPEPKKALK